MKILYQVLDGESKIGCPAETRFLKFEVIGNSTATGVYEAYWEDR